MSIISRLTTWTVGQLLKSADLNGEFNNIVNTLNNLDAATTTWDNVKTTSLTIAVTGAGTNAAGYLIGTVVQRQSFVDTSTTSSIGTAFTSTATTVSITPKATTHVIRISVTGMLGSTAAASSNTYVTLLRGATNLGNATNGMSLMAGGVAGNTDVPCSLIYIDSPGTTSSTPYTVSIKSDLTGDGRWNSTTWAYISVEEIAA